MFIYKVKNNLLNKGFSSNLIDKCLSKINIYEKKDNLINDFNKLLKKGRNLKWQKEEDSQEEWEDLAE